MKIVMLLARFVPVLGLLFAASSCKGRFAGPDSDSSDADAADRADTADADVDDPDRDADIDDPDRDADIDDPDRDADMDDPDRDAERRDGDADADADLEDADIISDASTDVDVDQEPDADSDALRDTDVDQSQDADQPCEVAPEGVSREQLESDGCPWIDDDSILSDVVVGHGFTLNTTECSNTFGVPSCLTRRGDGTPLCVLFVRSLQIGAEIFVRGTNQALIVATSAIRVDGMIAARASGAVGGPGGGVGSTHGLSADGTAPGADGILLGDDEFGGGGGGGFAGVGGSGGCDGGGEGGRSHGSCHTIELLGGSGGGHGAAMAAPDTLIGGGGGGVLHLFSLTTIEINGGVLATGADGESLPIEATARRGAGGGGSGGTVVLEAPLVLVDGLVSAVGGNGGRVDDEANTTLGGGQGSGLPGQSGICTYHSPHGGSGGAGGAGRIYVLSNDFVLTGTLQPIVESCFHSFGCER